MKEKVLTPKRQFAIQYLSKFSFLIFIMVVMTSSLFTSCQDVQKEDPHIGLQLWSVRDAMNADPSATLKEIADMGYAFIEAAGYSDGKFYGMEPEAFRALVASHGLEFLASHATKHINPDESYEEHMHWWIECIDAHKRAGVKYIIQASLGPIAYETLDGLQQYIDYFEAVGAKCNEQGLKFGFHNHDSEFSVLDGQVMYEYMLQNTTPENVFFQMDLYWVIVGGADPVYYFNKYPGRFTLLHVKDYEELGASGEIDFEYIFANAENSGKRYLVVEVEKYNYDPLESVRYSLDFLLSIKHSKNMR